LANWWCDISLGYKLSSRHFTELLNPLPFVQQSQQEANSAIQLLNEIRQKQHKKQALIFGFSSATETDNKEYSVVHLIILGVIKDYTKDYNSKKFSLVLEADWLAIQDHPEKLAHYLAGKMHSYTQRYQVRTYAEID
jgi:hypothetical protein